MAKSNQDTDNKPKYPWDETIRTWLIALLLALVFRSLAFEPFHIPSGSMKSTLLVGDYLFVAKYEYGYSRYSFPFGLPPFSGRIFEYHKPQRGDVVVFREPADTQIDFIKRIIGLPGDTIQLKDGIVYLNGKPIPRTPDGEFSDAENPNNIRAIPRFTETLPGGKRFVILKERPYGLADDTPVFHVPPDHYFMMGDNRDNSRDSRFPDVGFVPAQNLVGKAEIIFFSANGTAEWTNPISWFEAMRFRRFFKWVE